MAMDPGPPTPPEPAVDNPHLDVDGDGIAWVTFDDPERKHNLLDETVMGRLDEVVGELEDLARSGQIRVVVFRSGKDGSFIAGADVDAIEAIEAPSEAYDRIRAGQAIYSRIERLSVPTVAAVDGLCLGGGTELGLACRFRLASDSDRTKFGLPEVQLGILPAWGGTTRLPRLVGLQAALDMLLTGRNVRASKARRIGLVSEVLPHAIFEDEVRDFALRTPEMEKGASRKSRGLLKRLMEDTAPGRKVVLRTARKRVKRSTGGHYPAPLAILELLDAHLGSTVERSLEAEARAAAELVASRVSKNLIHIFHLREASRKDARVPGGVEPRAVDEMGVLGAGVMGGGIAQLAAYEGIRVRMKDIEREAVGHGLQHAREMFDKAVEKRKLKPREADRRMELVSGGVEYHGFARMDLVVEAVVERMDVKRAVLREVEERVPETCVLATNTSSLSVDGMAAALERPGNFAGMHFFNPVHRMPLVEVVRGSRTDDVTVATVHALAVRLGKVPVVCRDGPGFLVNRILGPYLNEAGWLLADGASIRDIDGAAKRFGMPMGPLRLVDEVGIDITRHAGAALHEAYGARMEPSPPLARIGESDRLGRKGGLGFYVYEGGKEQEVDDAVYEVLGDAVPDRRRDLGREEIRSRLVLCMVNEAARILEDRIVDRPGDVDLAMVMGTGFPPFRGGLLRFADALHPRHVVDRLDELRSRLGVRFEPAPLLLELARKDRTFYGTFGPR
ncbi:MAG: 3-hydroxyacyl-CoA dehydrogenase NAD-binding domain-containing protein [Gemmatimonadota bacterium]|jgi:3-hydroxyacyl-CoA dehydrogenase/enoyl-CoA hydratase/3-hydroxybutyryl-CoA epimerase